MKIIFLTVMILGVAMALLACGLSGSRRGGCRHGHGVKKRQRPT